MWLNKASAQYELSLRISFQSTYNVFSYPAHKPTTRPSMTE